MVSKLKNMRSFMKVFFKDEDGATAIEYGLFAALIAAVIVGAVFGLGSDLKDDFSGIRSKLASPTADAMPSQP